MAFLQHKGTWHSCEDENHKVLGGYNMMVNHCRKNKIIPYLIFYQMKPRRLTESTKETDPKVGEEESVSTTKVDLEETKGESDAGGKLCKLESIPRHLEDLDDIGEVEEDLETTALDATNNRHYEDKSITQLKSTKEKLLKTHWKLARRRIVENQGFGVEDLDPSKKSITISCEDSAPSSESSLDLTHKKPPATTECYLTNSDLNRPKAHYKNNSLQKKNLKRRLHSKSQNFINPVSDRKSAPHSLKEKPRG